MEKCAVCQDNMTQASPQNEFDSSPSTTRDDKESRVNRSLSSFKHSKACFCDRGPCDCPRSRSISKPKLSEYMGSNISKHRCISFCQHECNKRRDVYKQQLREIISNWAQDLPVYANFNAKDAMKKEVVINDLIDTLGRLEKDDKYFEKVEDEIKKCIKVIPMWRPENKEMQETFENQIASSILNKIKSVRLEKYEFKDEISKWVDSLPFKRKSIDKEAIVNQLMERLKPIAINRPLSDKDYKDALKSEIASTLNELPIEYTGSRTTVINNIAEKLAEKLHAVPFDLTTQPKQVDIKNLVLDWITDIPKFSNEINLASDDVLVDDLIMRLTNLQNENTDFKQEQVNDIITNWFNYVEEKKKCLIDRNTRNMLTDHLMSKITNARQMLQPKENINNVVQKWFDYIQDTLGVSLIDNKQNLETLIKKLEDLQSIENSDHRQNTMRQEIMKWLQNLQERQNRYIESGIQENIVNKLISMIERESKSLNDSENGLITQNIWHWLESQPEFRQDNSLQYRDMVSELSEKLQQIKDDKGELTENDINTEVTRWFQKLAKERGIRISPDNQKQLQEKLLSAVNPVQRRKNWEKSSNIQEVISKEVSNIINDFYLPLDDDNIIRLKEDITQALTQDLNAIQSEQTSELISKIKNILKQATNLPEIQANNLAHNLVEKIKVATLSNLGRTLQEGPLILDDTLKEKLKSKVENTLKMLPLKDRRKVIDTITEALIKNYGDSKSDGGFDIIYEELKKSNVSDAEAQEVTNNLLEMSNQFRNEITETTYDSPPYGSAESLWMQKQIFMQRLEKEITDFMEKVINESSSFYKDKTSGDTFASEPLEGSIEYNKFKFPLKTSTPTKSDSGRDMQIESQYKNQMKEIIKNWIESLQIGGIDENFKDDMADDIAKDIIDRERYKQLSKTKPSSQDEIEHLKYQIFKWTSKLPNPVDLTAKTPEIKKLIESLEVLGIPDLIRNDMTNKKRDSSSAVEYDGKNSTQITDEFIVENICKAIWNWLNEIRTLKDRSSQDRRIINDVIYELSNKLKDILRLDDKSQDSNVEKLCKDEIVNFLRKLNQRLGSTIELLEHRASDLINHLKTLEFFNSSLKQHQDLRKKDAIKKAVQNWCQKLPLQKGKTYDDMKDIVDNLAEAVSRYLLITDMDNVNTFIDEILNYLKKLPLQFDKEDSKRLPECTERLIETLKAVLNDSEKYYSIEDDSVIRKPFFKKAVEVMYDNIQNWCENLPLELGNVTEAIDQVNLMKQNLAGKLLKKVGELNLDPEIFHDDYLYEDVLRDEIDKILEGVAKTKEFAEVLPTLKENLIKNLLEIKEHMKNEMAGFEYKQKLRDAISKTLSAIGLSMSEETPFELLKENLADAFISLHYVADDEELKRKFKDKIVTEVNKFCDDYLKRNPSSRLNAQQLNQDLYKALKKVPVPKEESMRREVEQIRVKDIVTDWLNDLPYQERPTQIQENKIVSILAKRLHEIEKEAEFNSDIDIDEAMNTEISKWLKKLKVKPANESNTEALKKSLIDKLKSTKNVRRLSESTVRKSINYEDLTSELEGSPHYPPSQLSPEDRAHLQRIKDRNSIHGTRSKPNGKKDASVSPGPTATGMQTDEKSVPDNFIYQRISQNASIQTIINEPEPPSAITPQVIVKEYYWNSNGSPTMQGSGSLLSGMQSPTTQLTRNVQQKSNIKTSHVTSASQTQPLPVSKATLTQEASIEQMVKTQIPNDTAQHVSNEMNINYSPDDYLQLNSRKRAQVKSCQPCRGRESGELKICPEAGTSKALQKASSSLQQISANERTEFDESRPEFWPTGHGRICLEDQDNIAPPCARHPVCQSSTKDIIECLPKRKKRSQQPCSCRTPLLTKCTIRPQIPCQHSHHSNKSCYVSRKHCPKCWDGFCPHPSYLYFRQD